MFENLWISKYLDHVYSYHSYLDMVLSIRPTRKFSKSKSNCNRDGMEGKETFGRPKT